MPRYRVTVRARLIYDLNVAAFNKEQAEDYVWSQIGEEGENMDTFMFEMDVTDIEVKAYERE